MSTNGNKMTLEEGKATARLVLARVGAYCSQAQTAGSIRRRKDEVGDVDLVVVVENSESFDRALRFEFQVIRNGPKVKTLVVEGRQVDIYVTNKENFEAVLMHRTGSIGHNIGIAQKAGKMGLHLNITRGLMRGDKVVANTEKTIFAALELPFKEPWERG